MSMTPDESRIEQQMEELYQEHKEYAIEEFTIDRLQSFYLAHSTIAQPPLWALAEARDLLAEHPSAAQVFAAVAIEVGLKEFYPEIRAEDLVRLPNYHLYLKLMIDGVVSKPFSAETLPPEKMLNHVFKT